MAGFALPATVPTEKSAAASAPSYRQGATGLPRLHFCHALSVHANPVPDPATLKSAWKILEEQMALVPEGEVVLVPTEPESLGVSDSDPMGDPIWVPSIYLDRYCVTNADYARFVASGGYAQDQLWPPEILSNVLQFVDSTGNAGPRYWAHGQPPTDQLNHPVVGICWYEANAFAHWCGKRLPTPAEWQRAATWATAPGSGLIHARYPWGESFDPSRCNTWNSGIGATVPVNEYYSGCTPNGVYQLLGNVWEWTAALFECDPSSNGDRVLTDQPLSEIRGGAFDTYFASQATGLFRTGQSLLHRSDNIGFRCCVNADQLVSSPDPYAFLEDQAES